MENNRLESAEGPARKSVEAVINNPEPRTTQGFHARKGPGDYPSPGVWWWEWEPDPRPLSDPDSNA
jgi:hypothetical protein